MFSMIVYELDIDDIEYGYCMDGPFDPANGYRFDREKILLDPYAKLVSGKKVSESALSGKKVSCRRHATIWFFFHKFAVNCFGT